MILRPGYSQAGRLLLFAIAGITLFSIMRAAVPRSRNLRQLYPGLHYAASDSDSVIVLPYPFEDRITDEQNAGQQNQFSLGDPENVKKSVEYNTEDHQYDINESIGKMFYKNPSYMSFEDYVEQEYRKSQRDYFLKKSEEENVVKKNALLPKLQVNSEVFDRLFGGNTVEIKPNGSAELIFGIKRSTNENPSLPIRSAKPPAQFDFDQKIQMNVVGQIGDKLKISTSYNTESQFDFENQMKIEYTGYDDDIVKKIELGNVALPLQGSLITGSQSLFGVKAALQFGRFSTTLVYSQQKGEKKSVQSQGGAQTSYFEVRGNQYEANRHYFLSQYFRSQYDAALSELPAIRSNFNITRVEVWITKRIGNVENIRNIVAFMDLGDTSFYNPNVTFPSGAAISRTGAFGYPANHTNNIHANIKDDAQARDINTAAARLNSMGFVNSQDFEKLEARLLSTSDYTLNTRLGYISLNQALNQNEVLAVAFEYTLNGQTYQVGEFSNGGISAPSALVVKLLKGNIFTTKYPTWDLMMKNIYSLGAYQVNPQDFKLAVMYDNAATGIPINYIPAGSAENKVDGIPLIRVFNLDKLNTQSDPYPDGEFDFVEGITVNASKGRIIFPVLEPFGSYLRSRFTSSTLADKYAFDMLYDSTKTRAQQDLVHDRFRIKGSYKSSSSSEINLGSFNIPQGSVTVTAGGQVLVENTDYTVDYNMGKVRIINPAYLNSNTPVKVDLESNSVFNQQKKSLMGSRMDYVFNKDFSIGGTILRVNERPLTTKVNIGDEAVSNTIVGLDGNYKTDSRLITKMIDGIPFYNTKEKSTVTLSGEVAKLFPGHNRNIGANGGTAYIDDFEGAKSTLDLKTASTWALASIPGGQPSRFPEGGLLDSLPIGYNRAKAAWYIIDPFFYDNLAPEHIRNNPAHLSNHYSRQVIEAEIFPSKQNAQGQQTLNLAVLNLAYYPNERGPYNYESYPSPFSAGLDSNGFLKNPESRWGGMMRKLETTDFEASNVEFLEFWLMDPFFYEPASQGGDLFFNIGNLSEDILKDGVRTLENALGTSDYPVPTTNTVITDEASSWGRIPVQLPLTTAFDNDESTRGVQDVGLDGLNSIKEAEFFKKYLDTVQQVTSIATFEDIQADPSGDYYHHFRGSDYDQFGTDILTRYKNFNGLEGNSPTTSQSTEPYPTSATTLPDMEDINKDGMFNETESYVQYKVSLRPNDLAIGKNYVTDERLGTVNLANGATESIRWIQFKIPIADPKGERIGGIEDFRSMNFIRVFLKGFSDTVVCRFARLQLVRSDWRRYIENVGDRGAYLPIDNDKTTFDISTVSLEENEKREPVNYVLPPGIQRAINPSGINQIQRQNEQALSIRLCNLEDGHGRAAYKNLNFDIRNYKKLRMFIHTESAGDQDNLNKGDLVGFLRLGSDFTDNYYEYEFPLTPSEPGTYDENTAGEVWRDSILINLEEFYKLKIDRTDTMARNPNWTLRDKFSRKEGANLISVVGSPRLNEVRTVMVGVKNPYRYTLSGNDDGMAKCAEVWFNELRVTEFEDKGGWAANARTTIKLADLGNVSVSGIHKSYNWGTLDQKMNERSMFKETSYEASANVELSKFIPKQIKVKIPMFTGYGETWKRPKFDPNDPDVPYQLAIDRLQKAGSDSLRKEFIHKTEDYTMRRSLNFTNVKMEKGKGKGGFYSPSNFSLTYAYNDQYNRTEAIEYKRQKQYKGGISYLYSLSPKSVSPFGKTSGKFMKSGWMKLVKDFNFSYLPSSFAFRTDLDRQYSESMIRNTTGYPFQRDTNVLKLFNVSRFYDFKYDITKGLKTDFQATNISRVDERDGRMNKKDGDYKADADTIKKNLYGLNAPVGGRTTEYRHNGNINYAVPINKIPLLSFMTSNVKYGFEYQWLTAPLARDTFPEGIKYFPDPSIMHTIRNSRNIQGNLNINLTSIYNKINYVKRMNQRKAGKPFPKVLRPIKTKEDTIFAKRDSIFQNNIGGVLARNVVRLLTGIKSGSISYTMTRGTLIPGFNQRPQFLGLSDGFKAPSSGFVLGEQRTDMVDFLSDRDWITKDSLFNIPLTKSLNENLQGKITLEPIQHLKIDLNGNRIYSKNLSEYYRYTVIDTVTLEKGFDHLSEIETGNFSISTITWKTAWEKQTSSSDSNKYISEAFENFRAMRKDISKKLNEEERFEKTDSVDVDGYVKGYSQVSQEVLIPAFLAAYTGTSPDKYMGRKNLFLKIPKPNWRVTYDGVGKMDWAKKWFDNITLSHAYKSTYSINSFTTSPQFLENNNGYTLSRNDTGDFHSKYQIQQVSLAEQFAPFFGIDMKWKNSLTSKFEYKKDRNLSLSLTNAQVSETNGKEYTFGLGYKFKELKIPFKINRRTQRLKNDLVLKGDYSWKRSLTITRQLVQESVQTTGGTKTRRLSLSVEYMVNERFQIRMFFDRTRNIPELSTSFPTTNWNGGLSLKFSISG